MTLSWKEYGLYPAKSGFWVNGQSNYLEAGKKELHFAGTYEQDKASKNYSEQKNYKLWVQHFVFHLTLRHKIAPEIP